MPRDYTSAYVPAVEFTEADLAANRQGRLSPEQELRLDEIERVRRRGAVSTTRWMALWCAGLLVVGAIIEVNDDGPGAGGGGPMVIAFGGIGVVLAVAITVSYLAAGRLRDR